MYHYGFGYAWENQETLENDVFLDEFKTRVFHSDKQVWSAHMSSMPKLRTLGLFKTNLYVENYLLLHINRRLRVALAKFRVGSHDLEIERGRYEDFRKRYLCFSNDPLNLHTFVNIMCTQSQEEIV